jgi:ATP-dependent protease ClpP protease subunit
MAEFDIINEFVANGDDTIDTTTFTAQCHRIFIDDEILDAKYYRKVILTIMKCSESDSVVFLINSIGGDMFTLRSIVETFKMVGVKTTAVIMAKCYSAASMLALSCDEIIVYPSAEMMIHTAQLVAGGSAGNFKRSVQFAVKSVESYIDDVYQGFLTEEEISDVKNDKEIYLDADQINTRLKRLFKERARIEREVKATLRQKKN